jgi:hypothetical protein
MPDQQVIEKAYVQKISWSDDNRVRTEGEPFYVQFNPESLKVNYTNQKVGGDQGEEAAIQFVGRGTTKLAVELLFDVTIPMPDGSEKEDVSELSQAVIEFLKPASQGTKNIQGRRQEVFLPPGIRFGWGTFLFDGVVDSADETLDFFSSDGKPLRATIQLAISKQEIVIRAEPTDTPGTVAQVPIQDGQSLQALADLLGLSDWRPLAAGNGIENPRSPDAGSMIDPSAPGDAGGLGGAFGAGASAGFGASASAGFGGASAGFGGASAGFGAPTLAGAGTGKLSLEAKAGLGFGATGSLSASAGGLSLPAKPAASAHAGFLFNTTRPR